MHGKGKTDRIDLLSFYPVLAYLAEAAHYDADIPTHPALTHQIVNDDPNPNMYPYELPDGSVAKVLILGRQLDPRELMDSSSKTWWPSAQTLKVMSKMQRRVAREGYLLPIVMSLCLALVAEMYTTTSEGKSDKHRIRLKYKSSPIADFGICVGSAGVTGQDRLAYLLPNKDILLGQNPDEHYWIYFTTAKGEDVTLDVGMFTFNMGLIVNTDPYVTENDIPIPSFAPAYFHDRRLDIATPIKLCKESHRISFLRNPKIQNMVNDPKFWRVSGFESRLIALMDGISGVKSNVHERIMLLRSTRRSCEKIRNVFETKQWKRYPSDPILAIEQDPNELDDMKKNNKVKKILKEHREVRKNSQRTSNID